MEKKLKFPISKDASLPDPEPCKMDDYLKLVMGNLKAMKTSKEAIVARRAESVNVVFRLR